MMGVRVPLRGPRYGVGGEGPFKRVLFWGGPTIGVTVPLGGPQCGEGPHCGGRGGFHCGVGGPIMVGGGGSFKGVSVPLRASYNG